MKRILTKALGLSCCIGAVVMSCAKSDLISAPQGREMSFSTHVSNATKGEIKTDFKIGDQFGIMATESPAAWSANDANWYLGGGTDSYVAVTNTQSQGGATSWKYNPVKLWPEVNKVSFFAFYPAASPTNGISNVNAVKGSPSLDFVVSTDIKSQVDLLRAEALNKFEEEVQLSFGHALTRISFAAKANVSATQRVRLDKITLKGIKNSGTLHIYDPARTIGSLDDMGGWSAQAGAVDYMPALSHEVASLVPEDLVPMTMEDQAMFMIPQQFAVGGGAKLEVVYSYSNDEGRKWINNSKFEIDLGEYTLYWNPGKSYRYVLTLSPANVYSFSADIIDWDTEIDVSVKNPFSKASLSIDPTGGLPSEVIVTETRGLELGYTLKSSDATWITISDNAAGTGAAGEVVYDKSGNITTKAYDKEKKWYIVTKINKGEKREGSVTLERAGMDPIVVPIAQDAGNPFKDVAALSTIPAYVTSPTKVEKMVVPNRSGLTNKLKATASWVTFSLDGQGRGVKELEVVGNPSDTPVTFYIHISSDITRTAKSANIQFETTNAEGVTDVFGTLAVRQTANTEYYAGRFAGALRTETVGDETHCYFDKLLFVAATDQATGLTWGPNTETGATDKWDGKANTAKLNTSTYPAAFACWSRTSTPANSFYLPAQNQSIGMWIAKSVLGTFASGQYWASTELNAISSMFFNFNTGIVGDSAKSYTNASNARCVREITN